MITLKWEMLGYTKFVAKHNGFEVWVTGKALGDYWGWQIVKDGIVVDDCRLHSPTTNELAARVQAEKMLNSRWIKKEEE